ncbi:MAG: hypothetical protein AAF573_18300, partial [Bacteroidota bacterium]
MLLTEFSYKREKISFKLNDLTIEEISFNECNLIVGKNGAGKSTVANFLFDITQLISGRNYTLIDGDWKLKFTNTDGITTYNLKVEKGLIISEEISSNSILYLTRTRGKGE